MKFSVHASETSKIVLRGFTESPCSDEEHKYLKELARSDDLHTTLASAMLSEHQVEGFFALAYALRMDYASFRKNLADAKAAQKQVSDAASQLLRALKQIERHDFIRPELRYAHDFLGWTGISTAPLTRQGNLLPISFLVEKLKRLATEERLKEKEFVGAAISSQKASAPHEFARAFLFMTPVELQERLCPAIATVVSLAHPEVITLQEIRRLVKNSPPKSA
jgi:hypothetical protein